MDKAVDQPAAVCVSLSRARSARKRRVRCSISGSFVPVSRFIKTIQHNQSAGAAPLPRHRQRSEQMFALNLSSRQNLWFFPVSMNRASQVDVSAPELILAAVKGAIEGEAARPLTAMCPAADAA